LFSIQRGKRGTEHFSRWFDISANILLLLVLLCRSYDGFIKQSPDEMSTAKKDFKTRKIIQHIMIRIRIARYLKLSCGVASRTWI
jgi:hypothetical protein